MYLFFNNLKQHNEALGHFITTKSGGFSEAKFSSMNLGLHTNDQPELVIKNRRKAFSDNKHDISSSVFMQQTHSANCKLIEMKDQGCGSQDQLSAIKDCDSMITKEPGIALTGLAADCGLIIFYDPTSNALGLAHAGWRGIISGVIENTIEKMKKQFGTIASDLIIGVGAMISKENYQVDRELFVKFSEKFPQLKSDYKSSAKYLLDLKKVIFLILKEEGIKESKIDSINYCSFDEDKLFFSYRRDGQCGRHALAAWIKNK